MLIVREAKRIFRCLKNRSLIHYLSTIFPPFNQFLCIVFWNSHWPWAVSSAHMTSISQQQQLNYPWLHCRHLLQLENLNGDPQGRKFFQKTITISHHQNSVAKLRCLRLQTPTQTPRNSTFRTIIKTIFHPVQRLEFRIQGIPSIWCRKTCFVGLSI